MKTYEIHLDDSLAEKFEIALQLTGETADEAIAKLARTYLADTFSAAANSMRGENGRSASQEQPQPERRTARRAANQPNETSGIIANFASVGAGSAEHLLQQQ